jgi:predicted phage terminase large subunit-like protein
VNVIDNLHVLLYNEKEDIIEISNSGALAEEILRKVKFELETNQDMIDAFGYQVNDEKWTMDHIILKNGNQLRAKGWGYQVRGFRPTRVRLDDLEDDEMVRSKDRRDKLLDWFLGALINTLEPNQQLVYIGTLLHPLSLLKRIILEDDPLFKDWTKRLYKAILRGQNGERIALWPEKWPLEALDQRLSEIGPHKFEAEYMNNPLADNTVVFHPDTYNFYEELPPVEIDPVVMTITGFDLIGSLKEFEGKDYVSLVTMSKTQKGRFYLRDARRGRWTQEEIGDNIIDVWEAFHPDAFVGEDNSFQQIVQDYLTRRLREEKKKIIPIQGIKLGSYTDKDPLRKSRDKVSRALTVQYLFTQRLVYLHRRFRDFYEELSTFPAGDYDDQVDSMVHALHVLIERVKLQMTQSSARGPGETPASSILPEKRFNKKFFADKGIVLEG